MDKIVEKLGTLVLSLLISAALFALFFFFSLSDTGWQISADVIWWLPLAPLVLLVAIFPEVLFYRILMHLETEEKFRMVYAQEKRAWGKLFPVMVFLVFAGVAIVVTSMAFTNRNIDISLDRYTQITAQLPFYFAEVALVITCGLWAVQRADRLIGKFENRYRNDKNIGKRIMP